MLAEKILKAIKMDNYTCYKQLQKLGFDIDNMFWKDYLKQYEENTEDIHQKIYIQYLCEQDIKDNSRKKMNTSTKKRIKAVEKFLEQNKRNRTTEHRPIFHHFLEQDGKIIYTNCHFMGVVDAAEVQGIDEKYNVKNIEGNFPDFTKVIPELKQDKETAQVKYVDVLATHKVNKANKSDYDIHIVMYDDNTIGGYNAEYLLHAFEVLGVDTITIERNNEVSKALYNMNSELPAQNLQVAKITADNTDSYFVVSAVRLSKDMLAKYGQLAG